MGETTRIEWTHRPGTIGGTWNSWQGCIKKSPGCDNCYMYRDKRRYGQKPDVVVRSSPHTFNAPLRYKEPHTLFTCSWSDFFNKEADDWRTAAWDIIRRTPQHTYLVLTKLPHRIKECIPADWGTGWLNVWLGVSAENQQWADIRIPKLLAVPAVVHFVSAEPLLGPINLQEYLPRTAKRGCFHPWPGCNCESYRISGVDWIIVGGESGPHARPMHPDWARSLRDQCLSAGAAFFFKQWGEYVPVLTSGSDDPDGRTVHALPNGTVTDLEWNGGAGPHLVGSQQLLRVGKRSAGDMLDGHQWHDFPLERQAA